MAARAADGRTDRRQGAAMAASDDFADLTDPYRRELLAHCYRMLGSVHDAEDQVQETLLRAWRSYGDFEGRASLRTWLYRIATNSCLRAIENRSRRPLPSGLGAPNSDPDGALGPERPEVPWLQPIPDALLPAGDPAAAADLRQSTRLALIAALQYLPGRQRAVLLLRDVLGWRAAEVAELLGTSTAAVNSMLQRARTQIAAAAPAEAELREPPGRGDRDLLDRYAAAFENADVAALMGLLTADAVLEMPPQPAWFAGRDVIGRFLAGRVLTKPGRFAMVATAANGGAATASYLRGTGGAYHCHAIQVVTVTAAGISRVVSFHDRSLFGLFGLPPVLPIPAAVPAWPQ
ncbi:MAG: sigma-70 family RNA polymerase sigma factor [Actinomycetota bacterium]